MEELNEMIKDYLAAKDTDYAVMINGDWGCGKSYYIRNDFQEAVTSVACPARDEKRLISYWDKSNEFTRSLWHKLKAKWTKETIIYDEKKYYPFYISLYGVSSVEDFNARVTDEFFGLIGKGGNMLSTFLDGKFNVRLPFSSGKLIPHNAVLVFDDLERICLDKISPIEVLGLINSFAEHRHLKVVIVCNEEAFRQKAEDGSVQLKLDDEYRQYKEKTIRFTYTCKADIWNVYHALFSAYKNEYGAYIEECTELILALFAIGGKSNIRTLKFFIEIYEKLYNEISALLSSDFSDKILDRMLISTLIYVMEYKQGVSAKDLLKLREPIGDTLVEMFENASPMEDVPEKEDSETYRVDKVREKYEQYYEDMVRLPWLITTKEYERRIIVLMMLAKHVENYASYIFETREEVTDCVQESEKQFIDEVWLKDMFNPEVYKHIPPYREIDPTISEYIIEGVQRKHKENGLMMHLVKYDKGEIDWNKEFIEAVLGTHLVFAYDTSLWLQLVPAKWQQECRRWNMNVPITKDEITHSAYLKSVLQYWTSVMELSRSENERLQYVLKRGNITPAEYEKECNVHGMRVTMELNKFARLGYLEKKGSGKKAKYVNTNLAKFEE